MAEYSIISSEDTTELRFLEYKQAQYAIRQRVGGLYDAAKGTLTMYADFQERIGEGGDLATLAEYHEAKAAGLAGAEATLKKTIQGLVNLVTQMQAASPGLFPGVPNE